MYQPGKRNEADARVNDRVADHMNLLLVVQRAKNAERLASENAQDANHRKANGDAILHGEQSLTYHL
jgi:hypothetical protein